MPGEEKKSLREVVSQRFLDIAKNARDINVYYNSKPEDRAANAPEVYPELLPIINVVKEGAYTRVSSLAATYEMASAALAKGNNPIAKVADFYEQKLSNGSVDSDIQNSLKTQLFVFMDRLVEEDVDAGVEVWANSMAEGEGFKKLYSDTYKMAFLTSMKDYSGNDQLYALSTYFPEYFSSTVASLSQNPADLSASVANREEKVLEPVQ